MVNKPRKRALVLSGGGGRGAYHIGVLRFLEEHEWVPDIVIGTSIGAVNGAAIASGHNSRSLWAMWQRLKTKHVQKLNWNPFEDLSLLDTEPLRETLMQDRWIDFNRVNSEEATVHLRVTAMEVESGQLRVFSNSEDVYPSKTIQEPLTIDHIIASCSIPLIYPATNLNNTMYWDGGTVANTPLSPAIDAGAEEIVVVLMTPWDEEGRVPNDLPRSLIDAAGAAFEWALLASFQADLKMFRRVNELVALKLANVRLQAQNAALLAKLQNKELHPDLLIDVNKDGIPDRLENQFLRQLPEPIIVSPQRPVPVEQIIMYNKEGHENVYRLGYEDARRAWRAAGRQVEGESG